MLNLFSQKSIGILASSPIVWRSYSVEHVSSVLVSVGHLGQLVEIVFNLLFDDAMKLVILTFIVFKACLSPHISLPCSLGVLPSVQECINCSDVIISLVSIHFENFHDNTDHVREDLNDPYEADEGGSGHGSVVGLRLGAFLVQIGFFLDTEHNTKDNVNYH